MTVLHTGSTQKFAEGWENIFGGKGGKKATTDRMAAEVKAKSVKRSPAKRKRAYRSKK